MFAAFVDVKEESLCKVYMLFLFLPDRRRFLRSGLILTPCFSIILTFIIRDVRASRKFFLENFQILVFKQKRNVL